MLTTEFMVLQIVFDVTVILWVAARALRGWTARTARVAPRRPEPQAGPAESPEWVSEMKDVAEDVLAAVELVADTLERAASQDVMTPAPPGDGRVAARREPTPSAPGIDSGTRREPFARPQRLLPVEMRLLQRLHEARAAEAVRPAECPSRVRS